jgi:hypothetical protein
MLWRKIGEWRHISTFLDLDVRWSWVVSFTPAAIEVRDGLISQKIELLMVIDTRTSNPSYCLRFTRVFLFILVFCLKLTNFCFPSHYTTLHYTTQHYTTQHNTMIRCTGNEGQSSSVSDVGRYAIIGNTVWFGLLDRFTDHFTTRLETTSNYSAIANLHTLQITDTHTHTHKVLLNL